MEKMMLIDAEEVEAVRYKCPGSRSGEDCSYVWRLERDAEWRLPLRCPKCGVPESMPEKHKDRLDQRYQEVRQALEALKGLRLEVRATE